MTHDSDVRHRVAKTYRRMLTDERQSACCEQTGDRLQTIGYDAAQLASLPSGATGNAFGCGSPVAFSDLRPGDVVLDLGCGAGIDLLLAAREVGPTGRVIGVDMTAEMVNKARANVAASGFTNVEVRRGIIEELPVPNESVDWVISNCVINLSPEKPRVFAEIARVLKPGGRMRVADIVAEDLPESVRRSDVLYDSCIAGAISEADYEEGLRTAGLTDVTTGGHYVYDRNQLVGLTGDEAPSAEANGIPEALAGRIWSVYFSAAKPPAGDRLPRGEQRSMRRSRR